MQAGEFTDDGGGSKRRPAMAETAKLRWEERAARGIVTSLPPTDSIAEESAKMEWYTRIITEESAPVIDALETKIEWLEKNRRNWECENADLTKECEWLEAQIEAMRPVVDDLAITPMPSSVNGRCMDRMIRQARAAQEKCKEGEIKK